MGSRLGWSACALAGILLVACGDDGAPALDALADVEDADPVVEAPRLMVSPTHLSFAAVQPLSTAEKLLTVANGGTAALVVTGFVFEGDPAFALQAAGAIRDATRSPVEQGFDPEVVIPAGGSVGMTVRFSPTGAEEASATLTLRSNDPDAGTRAVVTVVGNPPAPCLAVSPKQVTFQASAGAADQAVTLSSCGEVPLTLTGLALDPSSAPHFSLELGGLGALPEGTSALTEDDPPVVLAAGAAQDVRVRYDPSAGEAPAAQGLVRIASDHAESVIVVPVTAK